MQIERILIVMQEFVVGIPMTWIRFLRRVSGAVIHYREAEEAAIAKEAEEQY